MLALIAALALLFLLTLLLLPALGRQRKSQLRRNSASPASDMEDADDSDDDSNDAGRSPAAKAARKALREDGRLTLPAINFRPNEAELSQPSAALREQLAVLGEHLTQNKSAARETTTTATVRVTSIGHTDRQGSREHNLALSLRRAEAIADLLAGEYRVPRERIRAIGRGFSEPVADNSTPDGRQRNRRVVVELE